VCIGDTKEADIDPSLAYLGFGFSSIPDAVSEPIKLEPFLTEDAFAVATAVADDDDDAEAIKDFFDGTDPDFVADVTSRQRR
jgi:hypothetical protein